MVRCNLTILVAAARYRTLPPFYAHHQVEIVSSLPCYTAETTDRQRGRGVFQKSVEALKRLNAVGYGQPNSGLELNLVYNPGGAFLPPSQGRLEEEYRGVLEREHGILFNRLLSITNMPIRRFLDHLGRLGQVDAYMALLLDSFNPRTVGSLMCRNTLSVGWDGQLYDCDFNQMLELPTAGGISKHIADFDFDRLTRRKIMTGRHCFGCTAAAGSGCLGAIDN